MERNDLIEKLAIIDNFMWYNPKAQSKMREWDNYSDEVLFDGEDIGTWSGVSEDNLRMAYNTGIGIIIKIDPDFVENNL